MRCAIALTKQHIILPSTLRLGLYPMSPLEPEDLEISGFIPHISVGIYEQNIRKSQVTQMGILIFEHSSFNLIPLTPVRVQKSFV